MCEIPWNIEQKWNRASSFWFCIWQFKKHIFFNCLLPTTYISEMASIRLVYIALPQPPQPIWFLPKSVMFHLWVICRKKERRRRTQSGTVCMTFRKEHFAWLKIDYFDLKKITDIIFQKEKKPRHDSFVCPFSAAAEQSISQHFVYCVVFSIGTYLTYNYWRTLKKSD